MLPLVVALNIFAENVSLSLFTYRTCIDENINYLPVSDAIICCIPNGLNGTIQRQGALTIHARSEALIVLSAIHSREAYLVFLFLTPSLLMGYGILVKSKSIIWFGGAMTIATYIFSLGFIIYVFFTATGS